MGDHDSHEVLQRIDALLPSFRDRAQETEDLRRIPDDSIKALQEAGFFKLVQPSQWGGFECDPVTFYTAVRNIASACGSTGWVAGILGIHNWHLALFSQQAQEDVWGADTDVRISSSYAPMGAGEVVDGGYKVNGAWAWSSGSDHATWVVVGGPVIKDGRPVDFGSFLIPRSEYEIDDVWNVVGLRGTGSKDLVIENAFLPEYRTLSAERVMGGVAWQDAGRDETLYRFPFSCIFPLGITSSLIGIAEGALNCYIETQRSRVTVSGTAIKQDPYVLSALGDAAAEIAASRAAILETVDRFWDMTEKGQEVTFEMRAIGRRTQTAAAWRAVRAVDEIFARAGGGALQLTNPLQRFWRDAHAGLSHAIHVPGSIFHAATLTQLGEEPQGMMRSMI